jgi:hypothetical protein
LIVSGLEVNGVYGGVFRAYAGDQLVKLTITNGFYMLVPAEYAEYEWCKLLKKADLLGWARNIQEPLEGWSCE